MKLADRLLENERTPNYWIQGICASEEDDDEGEYDWETDWDTQMSNLELDPSVEVGFPFVTDAGGHDTIHVAAAVYDPRGAGRVVLGREFSVVDERPVSIDD